MVVFCSQHVFLYVQLWLLQGSVLLGENQDKCLDIKYNAFLENFGIRLGLSFMIFHYYHDFCLQIVMILVIFMVILS